MTRVLIVDDHAVVRAGLRLLLDAEPDIDVVGEAGSIDQAIFEARALKPDIILMDVHMPGVDGLAATRAIRTSDGPNSRTPIIALTADARPEQVVECTKAGMSAYLTKPISVVALLTAMADLSRPADGDGLVAAA